MELAAEDLFAFDVLYFENIQPDVQVHSFTLDSDLERFAAERVGADAVSTIVTNLDPCTRGMCPYVRIMTSAVSPEVPINHKLQTFLVRIGATSLFPRCFRAVAVGLSCSTGSGAGSVCVPMPTYFYITSVPVLELGVNGSIDMDCLTPIGSYQGHQLKDIPGIVLPCHLPDQVQDRILSFMREPTADIIVKAMDDLCANFDRAVYPIFRQAYARVPPSLACFYNAPTVRSVIRSATRFCLARRA